MSADSCYSCHWKCPPSVAWILKLDHGRLIHNNERIERQLAHQLVHTRHVAIVCVLGERESGKSLILDALIRRLVGKDVPTFVKPDGLPVHRSDDLNIVTSALIMTHLTSEDVGVLFVDVRSRTPSSLSYLQLVEIANKFATIKLIAHYKRLSPELSQMAAEGVNIHVKSDHVRWDGIRIKLSEDLFGRFCKVIQDAGCLEHTPYFRLEERFRQSYVDLEGRQNQRMQSNAWNQNTPQYMPDPRPHSSCITYSSFPRQSASFGPHADTKPPQYPHQLHKEPKTTRPGPPKYQLQHDKSASQASTISHHFQTVPIDKDEADEPNPEELTRFQQPMAPSSYFPQLCHSAQARINRDLKKTQSAVDRQLYSINSKRNLILKLKTMRRIAKTLPGAVLQNRRFLQADTAMQRRQSCVVSLIKSSSLPPQKYAQVAPRISERITVKKVDTNKPSLENSIKISIEETGRETPEEESQLFQTEYARALEAVEYAVTKFREKMSSYLPVLMTTADQNYLLSSYATIIMKAFKSDGNGPAWNQAAQKELKPRLDEHIKELRQANKNTMRRWDKALDSALRQCGQVYHAEMQRCMQSKTKVSTTELDNCHLNAMEPTLKAFSVPTEVKSRTRATWDAVLNAKLEEWKDGFMYLNEKTPEEPVKVTACPPVKEEVKSAGIYPGNFLSQWDRQDLEEDLPAMTQRESTEDIRTEKDFEQDDSTRGQLVRLIQRVRDSLEDPSFQVGPNRDLLFERVELYSDVLANDCASERDLDKALLKLQAFTERIL